MTSDKKREHEPGRMDRRGVFRGAAMLGGLGAAGLLAPVGPFQALAAEGAGPLAAKPLPEDTQRILRWTGPGPADWVTPRADVDHNVVIVGGGQTGIGIAYWLGRKGIGRVVAIDQAEPGQAGIWRTTARMRQLNTVKTIPGLGLDNAGLSFRAWYETLHGQGAFDALDRAPRLVWADYLAWFQQVTGTPVRYRTRLVDIEPVGDILRLHLEVDGVPRTETTRKLVLADGYIGAGGGNVPDFLRVLPSNLWTHSASPIRAPLAGKVVGVLGAGSSAFDAAATALESGAAQVHLFSRKSFINYRTKASAPDSTPLDLYYGLPDAVKWRNQLLKTRAVTSVLLDSLERAVTSDRFYLYVNSPWNDIAVDGDGKVVVRTPTETFHFDHILAGTGYRVDLAARPELARIRESIALWRDRFQPGPGEADVGGGFYPYLGAGFQFLPRQQAGGDYLRNIHCINLAASLSFGTQVGNISSMVLQPQLVSAIAQDLYADGIDLAASKRALDAPPPPPPDPAPYRRALH